MPYTIVVGVNESVPSSLAVRWSAARAAAMNGDAELILVHVLDAGSELPASAAREVRREASSVVKHAAQLAQQSRPNLTVRTDLRVGNVIDALLAAAVDANLIVVGTHKTGFIRGRSMGTRSLRIAAAARVPVVVVPESSRGPRSGIVVGVEESDEGMIALEFAANEAASTGQELTLIRAWDTPRRVGVDLEITVSDLESAYAADSKHALAGAVTVVHRRFPHLITRSRQVRRRAAEALLDAAASASLLVIGETRHASDQPSLGDVGHDVLINIVGPTVIVHSIPATVANSQSSHAIRPTTGAAFAGPAQSPQPDMT